MKIEILHTPDCPNAAVLAERVAQVLPTAAQLRAVSDEDEAATLGMTGSPTLLVDGADPFGAPGRPPSLACRLYLDEDGVHSGAPSVAQLHAALGPDWRRDGPAAQQAALPGQLRELHRSILRFFLAAGGPPDTSWLAAQCARLGIDPDEATAALAAAELVQLDDAGTVAVAYPFSAVATGHRVTLASGTQVWAMCAIDALGVALLSGGDATIDAADPSTGDEIEVALRAGVWQWRPESTVVLMVHVGSRAPGAVCTCELVNFYARTEAAVAVRDARPELHGDVLDQDAALARALAGFRGLLG